jgi:hypothetical protein
MKFAIGPVPLRTMALVVVVVVKHECGGRSVALVCCRRLICLGHEAAASALAESQQRLGPPMSALPHWIAGDKSAFGKWSWIVMERRRWTSKDKVKGKGVAHLSLSLISALDIDVIQDGISITKTLHGQLTRRTLARGSPFPWFLTVDLQGDRRMAEIGI